MKFKNLLILSLSVVCSSVIAAPKQAQKDPSYVLGIFSGALEVCISYYEDNNDYHKSTVLRMYSDGLGDKIIADSLVTNQNTFDNAKSSAEVVYYMDDDVEKEKCCASTYKYVVTQQEK